MFSVADAEEARKLLVMTCPTNVAGEFIAPELASEQTLEHLADFSDRLHVAHERLKEGGRCRCQ